MNPASPLRFNIFAALWTAAQRLRQRWSPMFAIAICLTGLPTTLISLAYAGGALTWGGLAVGTAVSLVLTSFAQGALGWLSLADGDDPWVVAAEGLGRALYRLGPLGVLVLWLNLPTLAVNALSLMVRTEIVRLPLGPWAWWGLSMAVWVLPAVSFALVAPVVGILMFEGESLRPALVQASRMTRGSRLKLAALEVGRLALLLAVGMGLARLQASLGGVLLWGLTALLDSLVTAAGAVVLNQAYMQLHGVGTEP